MVRPGVFCSSGRGEKAIALGANGQEPGARFPRPQQAPGPPQELVASARPGRDEGRPHCPDLLTPLNPQDLWRPEMGARPSRRRLPADQPVALDALPPELLVQVLSHVPPRALVTRCRAVCRAWRDVVDGPTVWLLQLARDRSAEGRALYAVAQRCPPDSEDEEFPLCALARYCLRAPLGRNLIFNSCGERACRGRGRGRGQGRNRVVRRVVWVWGPAPG